MNISALNVSFNGRLYLKRPEFWTEQMKKAISENKSVQEKLKTHNITGEIDTKIERRTPPYYSYHNKGDLLYKLRLYVQQDAYHSNGNFIPEPSKYEINKHFHSEHTTVERLKRLNMQ